MKELIGAAIVIAVTLGASLVIWARQEAAALGWLDPSQTGE